MSEVIFKFAGRMDPDGLNATHEDLYGKGGFVAITGDSSNLNNNFFNNKIPLLRRKVGMIVRVVTSEQEDIFYTCTNVGTEEDNGEWDRQYFTAPYFVGGETPDGQGETNGSKWYQGGAANIEKTLIDGVWITTNVGNRYFYGDAEPDSQDLIIGDRWFNTIVGSELVYIPTDQDSENLIWVDLDHLGGGGEESDLSGFVVRSGDVMDGSLTGPKFHADVISGTNANFTDSLTAENIRSNGNLSAVTITGTNANFTDSLTAGNIRSNGNLSAVTITGTNANFTDSLTAGVSFLGGRTAGQANFIASKNKFSENEHVWFVPNYPGANGQNAKLFSIGFTHDRYSEILSQVTGIAIEGGMTFTGGGGSITASAGLKLAVFGKSFFTEDAVIRKVFRGDTGNNFFPREMVTQKYVNDNYRTRGLSANTDNQLWKNIRIQGADKKGEDRSWDVFRPSGSQPPTFPQGTGPNGPLRENTGARTFNINGPRDLGFTGPYGIDVLEMEYTNNPQSPDMILSRRHSANVVMSNDFTIEVKSFPFDGLGKDGTGPNNTVFSMVMYSDALHIGGSFTAQAGFPATRIAKWTPETNEWSGLGAINDVVYAMTVGGDNNETLYVGGGFTTVGVSQSLTPPTGVTANRIASWDGNSWSALASGLNGIVYAMLWHGNNLYVGGDFTTAGGVPANYIAKWNGTSWSPLTPGGSGLDGIVRTIAIYNGGLYAGGDFTGHLSRWDLTAQTWSNIGITADGRVRALAVLNDTLYAGGNFLTIGGINARRIAYYNGTNWFPLVWNTIGGLSEGLTAADGSAGTSGAPPEDSSFSMCYALKPLGFGLEGKLYVAGSFQGAGGWGYTKGIARWTPPLSAGGSGLTGRWDGVFPGVEYDKIVHCLEFLNPNSTDITDNLIIGGSFNHSQDINFGNGLLPAGEWIFSKLHKIAKLTVDMQFTGRIGNRVCFDKSRNRVVIQADSNNTNTGTIKHINIFPG
jgi:hypothetical protein